MTDQTPEAAAAEYVDGCEWQSFIYEDKSTLTPAEQRARPSDIPANLKLAFLAGVAFAEGRASENLDLHHKAMIYNGQQMDKWRGLAEKLAGALQVVKDKPGAGFLVYDVASDALTEFEKVKNEKV